MFGAKLLGRNHALFLQFFRVSFQPRNLFVAISKKKENPRSASFLLFTYSNDSQSSLQSAVKSPEPLENLVHFARHVLVRRRDLFGRLFLDVRLQVLHEKNRRFVRVPVCEKWKGSIEIWLKEEKG